MIFLLSRFDLVTASLQEVNSHVQQRMKTRPHRKRMLPFYHHSFSTHLTDLNEDYYELIQTLYVIIYIH